MKYRCFYLCFLTCFLAQYECDRTIMIVCDFELGYMFEMSAMVTVVVASSLPALPEAVLGWRPVLLALPRGR